MITDRTQRIRRASKPKHRPTLASQCQRTDAIFSAAYQLARKDHSKTLTPADARALAVLVAMGKSTVSPREFDKHSGVLPGTTQGHCDHAHEQLRLSPAFHTAFHSIRSQIKP